MKVDISLEELQKRSLFVATPMYGGACHGMFCKSIADLTRICVLNKINMDFFMLMNESLITRARNYAADEFMRSKHTHMLFIDSDIGFDPRHVIGMLSLQSDDSPYDIIGGAYPKKAISWEKIKQAVDKGVAYKNNNELENYVGDFVFNPISGCAQIPLDVPSEVFEIGTGFMMIRRKTFEKFREAFPQNMYKPDHVRSEHFDGSREICMYFQAEIEPVNKRYLSEDYYFTQKTRSIGLKTFLCPWIRLAHAGNMVFEGSLAHLASIGAAPTADASQLGKAHLFNK